MKKQYAWDQVDRLAEEWYATPAGEEHAAIKQKLLEEFLGLSCNLLSESMMEGLGDFWEQDFQRFDPALSPFSKFLLSRLKLRVRDGVREDLGLRRVKRDGETVTEGAFSLDDTGGKDADDDMTREVRDPRAEEALEELRAGHIIITIDDPDRENEGDMICAAQFATTENVNRMATDARGLICTPMSAEVAARLGLEQMVKVNTDNHGTAFTVSIDHVDTTTGISAAERGFTCRACVDPATRPEDLRRPGHVFPLVARRGGVLVRNGHTEATVDLCRLAGLTPCGLCCEIMGEDGTMLRTTQLLEKAKVWGMKVLTIQALQDYCRRHDKHVTQEAAAQMPTRFGDFRIYGYVNDLTGEHHVALVKGDLGDGRDVLCRVHSECLTGDVFGSRRCDCGQQLAAAIGARRAGASA